jgi:hypothetical protein
MSTLIEETVASAEAARQPETGDGMRKMAQIVGGGMIAAAAGLTFAGRANAQAITDADILNFALNLEYLEAEFYLAAVGRQPSYGVTGAGTQGTVTGGRAVNFTTSEIRQYAEEIAADEEAHVRFLRQALGSAAVARPAINFTDAFNAAARLAFNNQSATFDPFANELFFLPRRVRVRGRGRDRLQGRGPPADQRRQPGRRRRHPGRRGVPCRQHPHDPVPQPGRECAGYRAARVPDR